MAAPLYYEDWEIDRVYETETRAVTQELADAFGEIERSESLMHLDEEFARTQTIFGKLSVHGLLTVSMAAGMMGKMGLFEGTALAFLELSWRYHAPVCVGDTIRVRWWVEDKRPTGKPDRGVVVRAIEVYTQDDVKACTGSMTTLWSRRPAAAAVESGH